jgi:hypothetical protein
MPTTLTFDKGGVLRYMKGDQPAAPRGSGTSMRREGQALDAIPQSD